MRIKQKFILPILVFGIFSQGRSWGLNSAEAEGSLVSEMPLPIDWDQVKVVDEEVAGLSEASKKAVESVINQDTQWLLSVGQNFGMVHLLVPQSNFDRRYLGYNSVGSFATELGYLLERQEGVGALAKIAYVEWVSNQFHMQLLRAEGSFVYSFNKQFYIYSGINTLGQVGGSDQVRGVAQIPGLGLQLGVTRSIWEEWSVSAVYSQSNCSGSQLGQSTEANFSGFQVNLNVTM